MREGAQKIRLFLMYEPQQIGDPAGGQFAEERTVDRLFLARIDQGPAPFFTGAAQLDMAIGPACGDRSEIGPILPV
jgi:hypothetical protein